MMKSEPRPLHVDYASATHLMKANGGRWGVGQGCDCRSILDAIATLIEAQRSDLAMIIIEQEFYP